MDVQVTVIGSSPAWPNPASAHSGYLVEAGGRRLLLDCGPGTLARLRAHELLPVDAIAITHFHLDHWGDLVPWVWFAEHGDDGAGHPALWIPPTGRDDLSAFAARLGHDAMFDRAFDVAEYVEEQPFSTAGFELVPVRVDHYGMNAFGLRVQRDGRTLAYSGDSAPCAGLSRLAAGADLFICEATLRSAHADASQRGHLAAEEALAAATGRVVLTHRPIELPPPDGVELAADGLVLTV